MRPGTLGKVFHLLSLLVLVSFRFAVSATVIVVLIEGFISKNILQYAMGFLKNLKTHKTQCFKLYGWVAQSVEHRTENPGVGGSIPPPATISNCVCMK